MNKKTFVEVAEVVPAVVPTEGFGISYGESIAIRDAGGVLVDTLHPLSDGNFQGRHGIVRREDVGEYVIRLTGHPATSKL